MIGLSLFIFPCLSCALPHSHMFFHVLCALPITHCCPLSHTVTCVLFLTFFFKLCLFCLVLCVLPPPCMPVFLLTCYQSLKGSFALIHVLSISCSLAFLLSCSLFPFCSLTHFHLLIHCHSCLLSCGCFVAVLCSLPPPLLPSCFFAFSPHLLFCHLSLSSPPHPSLSNSLIHLKFMLPYFF